MRSLEALMDAIGIGSINERTRRFSKPGDVIQRMSHEHREALSRLTSEDTQKVRMDLFLFWDVAWDARCARSKMFSEFDRKLIS